LFLFPRSHGAVALKAARNIGPPLALLTAACASPSNLSPPPVGDPNATHLDVDVVYLAPQDPPASPARAR
jgi:hypothetical protein